MTPYLLDIARSSWAQFMPFTFIRTITFADTDAAGVVYFANILSICHEAYEASLSASGVDLKTFFSNDTFAIPIVHSSANFFQPLYCGDRTLIELTPQTLKPQVFEIDYKLCMADARNDSQNRQYLATASTRHVCIDPQQRLKCNLPSIINDWLQQWQS